MAATDAASPPRRTSLALTMALAAIGGSVWLMPQFVPIPVPGAMIAVAIAVSLSAATAIAGLQVAHRAAPWFALIAVTLAATILCCAWSLTQDPRPLIAAGSLLIATTLMTFAIGSAHGDGVTWLQRSLFTAVAAFATWVAAWGWFNPTGIGGALPISAPPLHARFLGAMYLSGCAFMLMALLARRWREIEITVTILAIWTGMLGLVSLLHLDAFDWTRNPTWLWFIAYLGFPLLAVWVSWCQRGNRNNSALSLPSTASIILGVIGATASVVGLALLLAPAAMAKLWPWPVPPLLAHIYGAPFLAYGIGCLLAMRRQNWNEIRTPVVGTLVFAVGALAASSLHAGLFDRTSVSAWIWFCGFGLAGLALAALALTPALRQPR